MKRVRSRREVLRLLSMGGLSVLAACSTQPTAQAPATTDSRNTPPVPSIIPTITPPALTATSAPAIANTTATASLPTAVGATPTATAGSVLSAQLSAAAVAFLDTLESEPRAKASYAFADAERWRWHWTMPSGFPRNGLPLTEMNPAQRESALALLRTSLAPVGLQKALDIMALQRELGNDTELYYVTVFGEPGGTAPWSWRWEGHHYSRHFTVVGERITATPFFHGAWPTTSDAGLRAMPREEDAARELVTSLSGAARDAAIFDTTTLTQHVTQNQEQVAPLDPVGVAYSELNPTQQALINEIITAYLGTLPEPVSVPILERMQSAGLEQLRFGWAGPLEALRPHYYRLQGPTFLLEFDNSRNGGTHIHSVWRDFTEDFGRHLVS